jgi:tRNA threonylcarbamoyladenosine biosynthesis protein TsaB
MKILGIETSGSLGGFALVDDGRLVVEIISDITGRHVEKGVDIIEDVLDRASVTVADLEAVAVSLGPGSFTGLRVGLAIAKGLCFGNRVPLVGVPTLDSIAESLSCWEGITVPMRDARRGEIYFSVYESEACSVTRIADYLALAPGRAVEKIKDMVGGRRVLLAGDALVKYKDVICSGLGPEAMPAPETMWMARPAVIACMGSELLKAGGNADIDTIEPMYVRPSEAERKAKRFADDETSRNTKDDR